MRRRVGDGMPRHGTSGEIEGAPILIGLELRYRSPMGDVEELVIFPLDIELPVYAYGGAQLTLTAHISTGDRNGTIPL